MRCKRCRSRRICASCCSRPTTVSPSGAKSRCTASAHHLAVRSRGMSGARPWRSWGFVWPRREPGSGAQRAPAVLAALTFRTFRGGDESAVFAAYRDPTGATLAELWRAGGTRTLDPAILRRLNAADEPPKMSAQCIRSGRFGRTGGFSLATAPISTHANTAEHALTDWAGSIPTPGAGARPVGAHPVETSCSVGTPSRTAPASTAAIWSGVA